MPGSPTAPGQPGAGESAPGHVAFHQQNCVGTRVDADFAAQWLAYALPDRRFACTLAGADARLGADVGRYSFIVVDSHHLLLAFPRFHGQCYAAEAAAWNLAIACSGVR
jgi:hypothetical protein